ncbi:hypothetical protein [Cellulomonas sp. SLBN-39]|uniref:hypothetical protein n=1 Tax=Cellulomonas sp. SLBN-39 TaxID=2768446 RepID=UPI00351BBC36
MLLAAYGLRRPTRDIDAQLVDQALDEAHLLTVVRVAPTCRPRTHSCCTSRTPGSSRSETRTSTRASACTSRLTCTRST